MIEVKGLKKIYNQGKKNPVNALNGVDLTIADGEMVAIVGTSGAGKSTLLYCIAGLEDYQEGSCMIDGTEIGKMSDTKAAKFRNEKYGFVLQDFALIDDYTVMENITLPFSFGKKVTGKDKDLALEVIKRVSLVDQKNAYVKELSGGQKQRTAIARALINKPSVIFADEPTGALDSKTTLEILELFEELNKDGITIIIVTHDKLVAEHCKRIITVEDGLIVSDEKN
ncbi:MAG: ABC transporter ATP-binding protein [Clostridiales bacterium]|nr:ABC transporter ATP-binding protein [Clostridiales bacterium]